MEVKPDTNPNPTNTVGEKAPTHIEYNFKCGIKALQGKIKVGAVRKIYRLLGLVSKDEKKGTSVSELLDTILDGGHLNELFSAVLTTEENCDWDDLDLEEALQVVSDFFILNKKAISLLLIGVGGADGLLNNSLTPVGKETAATAGS